MAHAIISRAEAKAQGLKRYFDGVPCPHGHISEREVANGNKCVECKRLRYAARTAKKRAETGWQPQPGPIAKACAICGAEFQATAYQVSIGGGKYCSNACRHRGKSLQMRGEQSPFWKGGRKEVRACASCGKDFEVFACRTGLYCSRKCANAGLIGKSAGEKNPSWAGGPETCSCQICGAEFKTKQANIDRGWGRFCSRKCKVLAQFTEMVELACDVCGVLFKRYPSDVAKSAAREHEGVHCSKKCRGVVLGESQRGEANSQWRGGITPENTRIRQSVEGLYWREAVLKRDDYTCRHCGAKGSKRRGAAVVLHVHHIKGFAAFPELRFDVDNGLTLCIPCHHKVHSA